MLLDYYTLFDILTAERVVGFFFFSNLEICAH